MVGFVGIPGIADYAASKFAVTGLLETVKYELIAAKKTGVHTSSIHPYIVDTDMFAGCSVRYMYCDSVVSIFILNVLLCIK